jgi:histidinol phosphatase-like PHP family hydrolase
MSRVTARNQRPASRGFDDVNAKVSFLLRDMAAIQSSREKGFGYKRAAAAVFGLDDPLTALWAGSGLSQRVPGIGPSSTRVSGEVLERGDSVTVEQAVDAAGKRADILKRRMLRANFLSRAAVRHVLGDLTLGGPTLADYRGDLQMHSEWSDGAMTLGQLTAACAARGYAYSAVTDHSYGLPIAGGMSMTDVTKQHREIDRLNAGATQFHLFKGIEANIGADGALDLSPGETFRFDVVLVAPHAKLRLVEDQTSRLVRAIEHPGTHILAHPRGRMAGTRAGVVADWDEVFERAAAANVAVEIDGDPARQDLDYDLASRALRAGCLFALDSDAHSPRELAYAETALAHARLANIPSNRIVNCWDIERFRQWLADRPKPRP